MPGRRKKSKNNRYRNYPRTMSFMMSDYHYNLVFNRAILFTNGNMSDWIRMAVVNYLPDAKTMGLDDDPGPVEDDPFF